MTLLDAPPVVASAAVVSSDPVGATTAAGPSGERLNRWSGLGLGTSVLWLSLLVLLPLAAVVSKAFSQGCTGFWEAISAKPAVSALELTVGASLLVAAINAVMGTLIAWVLVRDDFRGRSVVNALVDLPFALPTIVAGLTLLALYGPTGPAPFDIGFTRAGILMALLFVTVPFVVRAVQPVLLALDPEVEEAAASLGAGGWTAFRRVILPALRPAILSGAGLAFGRALGEFGAIVLISGNIPFKTELASVFIYGQLEEGSTSGAAAVSIVLVLASLAILFGLATVARRGEVE
jgi:sulfate/thiosulfate transport system permease protein